MRSGCGMDEHPTPIFYMMRIYKIGFNFFQLHMYSMSIPYFDLSPKLKQDSINT